MSSPLTKKDIIVRDDVLTSMHTIRLTFTYYTVDWKCRPLHQRTKMTFDLLPLDNLIGTF